jgi:hypothetical protein
MKKNEQILNKDNVSRYKKKKDNVSIIFYSFI